MKTYLGILTILLITIIQAFPGFSQQLFHDTYDVPNFKENAVSIAKLSNGDLALIGVSNKSTYSYDFYNYLHRTDANGNTLIHNYYQEANPTYLKFEDLAAGGFGYITAGRTLNSTGTVQQVTKMNPDGSVHWARKLTHHTWQGEVHDPHLNSWSTMSKVNDESFVLAGEVTFSKESQLKYYAHFAIMDLGGQWLHSNLLDLTPYTDDIPRMNKIVKVGDNFIATGIVRSEQDQAMIVVRLDHSLNVIWLTMVSNFGGRVFPTGLTAVGAHEFMITGLSTDLFVLRMDINGQLISLHDYIWPEVEPLPTDVFVDTLGNIYVTGSAYINKYFEGEDADLFVMKTDPWGFVNGVRHFGLNGVNEYTSSSLQTGNELFVMHAETGGLAERYLVSVSSKVPFPCDEELIQVEKNSGDYVLFDLQVVQRTTAFDLHEMQLVVDEVALNRETCGHTNPYELNLPVPPETQPQRWEIEFDLFPNPTYGPINISWETIGDSRIDRIEICDLTGKKIFTEDVNGLGRTEMILPNSGIYMVSLIDGHGEIIWREKVIRY